MLYKVLISILCTIVLFACSSVPKSYPPYEQAKSSLEQSKQEQDIQNVAAVTLFQADEYLAKAESALTKNDTESADHYIYLAKRKQEIAHELLLKHQQEQQIAQLKQQQDKLIALARRNESTRAKKQTQRAHQQTQKSQQRIKQLEQTLGQYQAEETSRGTLLVINDLLFDSGGANLAQASERRLIPLLQYLQANRQREIIIEGHTDSLGNENTNKRLSLQRAETVKTFLTQNGIETDRIESRGFGEEAPIASNTTNAGRKLNRRVEVIIKPVKR